MGEGSDLIIPVRTELRCSVKADFADVARVLDEPVKQGQFMHAFMRELGVKTKRCADAVARG